MPEHPKSKIRAFMKFPFLRLLLCVACALATGTVGAEKADRKQPMNIEADSLRYDDLKQTSVFSGNVVLTRGSIIIKGARIEVRQDAQGYQFGVVTAEPGQRAYFRQKRDDSDEYIEGESETIEYDGRADVFRLIKDARLRRLRGTQVADVVTGDLIQYNSLNDIFTVDGGTQKGGERVRATLTPRSEAPQPPASRPVAAPPLRSDETLGGGRK
jgi:lipopolysaccharide export system protein LptA